MSEPRRVYALALLLLAVGGGILLWASSAAWAQAQVPLAGLESGAMRTLVLSGRDLAPVTAVMGVVAWAGIPGLVATRGWGRPVIGAIAAGAGVIALGGSAAFGVSPSGRIDQVASSEAGTTLHVAATWSGWWLAAALGAALVLASGVAALVRGRTWPAMGSRYDRGPAPRDPWAQLDAGQDPTVDSD